MAKRGNYWSYTETPKLIESASFTKDNYLAFLDDAHHAVGVLVEKRNAEIQAEYDSVTFDDTLQELLVKKIKSQVIDSFEATVFLYEKALVFNKSLSFFKRIPVPMNMERCDIPYQSGMRKFTNACVAKGMEPLPESMVIYHILRLTAINFVEEVTEGFKAEGLTAWQLKQLALLGFHYYDLSTLTPEMVVKNFNRQCGLENKWIAKQKGLKDTIDNVKTCTDAVFTIDIDKYNTYAKFIRDAAAK